MNQTFRNAPDLPSHFMTDEQQALAQLARLGPAGRGEVAIQLGCSPRTATRILGRLTERGLVIRDGDGGRGVRYRVVDAAGVQWENRQQ